MEVNSSSRRIKKFNDKPGTISLREFKATFSIVVYELELKYGTNYTKAFAFKQLPIMCTMKHWMFTSNICRRFWASLRSPIQLMPQPSPSPLKLHYKLPLHVTGLSAIIQIRYLLQ